MAPAPNDPTGVQRADAQYQPFSGFDAWRGLPVATDLWDRFLGRLNARRVVVGEHETELGTRRSMVAAALNTGAVEGLHRAGRGLTETVVQHVLDWQRFVRADQGSPVEDYVEAGLAALNMALDVATGQMPKLTEAWIRELHRVACGPQTTVNVVVRVGDEFVRQEQLLLTGEYKRVPNHVTLPDGSVHSYCPVDQVPFEVERLVRELNQQSFLAAHPVLQVAFAHHAFVCVHPFQDGNGRVARALASVFLLRAASIPLLVYDDQQAEYFDALAAADGGEYLPFVRFVQDRALDLMALTTDLLAVDGDEPPRLISPFERLDERVIEAAHRLDDAARAEFRSAVEAMVLSPEIERSFEDVGHMVGSRDEEGRRTVRPSHPHVRLQTKLGVTVERWLAVFASSDQDAPFELALRLNGRGDVSEYRLNEFYPSITTSATVRLGAFVRRIVQEMAAEMQAELDRR